MVERADGGREKQDKTMKLNHKSKNVRAFTLVEILVVVSIMLLLLELVIGLSSRVKEKAEESRLTAELAAIELALENYKAAIGNYPPSSPWGNTTYPGTNWSGQGGQVNQLYKDLVDDPLKAKNRPFLPDIKESGHLDDTLVAPTPDRHSSDDEAKAKWYYNSFDPKFNKNSYDLWVEFGGWGDDGERGTADDILRVISNWE